MRVKLKKLSHNKNRLRTKQVTGDTDKWPVVGEPFEMTAKPLQKDRSYRLVTTSPVVVIERKTLNYQFKAKIYFKTMNSRYSVEGFHA